MTHDHHVHVVTDSTASLPRDGSPRLHSVPLHVVVDDVSALEGVDITADDVAARLAEGRRVTTSQPSPRAFADADAAALAAADAPVPVRVVDSRTVAMGLGFAATAAADVGLDGADVDTVARRALAVADTSRAVFLVDSLDHLRRGGRLSAASAALGTVLGVRPLLAVRDGRIEVVQKVRTKVAAVERLTTVAVESAGRRHAPVLAVHHVGDDDGARRLASELTARTGLEVTVTPVSAVLGAHVGPGVLAVVVADLAP